MTFDCHNAVKAYHDAHVTLSNQQQAEMRLRREAGRTRLKNGLTRLQHPQPVLIVSQGSYQMRTMVQDPDNDYDIDDGVYFLNDDLSNDSGAPLTPYQARLRIQEALIDDDRLKAKAEIKSNCVRQRYQAGCHIDIPVYRIEEQINSNGDLEQINFLASGDEWIISDAQAVTTWFNHEVKRLNAEGELEQGQCDGSQMRRITKLSKAFSRCGERKDKATSGITVSKLVVDHYVPAATRDDLSLIETWRAIQRSLQNSTQVDHPVNSQPLATAGNPQVQYLLDCLDDALSELAILEDANCTVEQAHAAWDKVFETDFFSSRNPPPSDNGGTIKATNPSTARRQDNGGRFG